MKTHQPRTKLPKRTPLSLLEVNFYPKRQNGFFQVGLIVGEEIDHKQLNIESATPRQEQDDRSYSDIFIFRIKEEDNGDLMEGEIFILICYVFDSDCN